MQISRNKGARKKASSRKWFMTKFLKRFCEKAIFYPKINLYIGINVLVYGKFFMVNIMSMTKKKICVKNPFLAKNTLFSKTNVSNKNNCWV